jgi:short-subunit dehydrogenase
MNKVLITGATSGLGKHLVSKFTDNGYEVFEHKGSKHYNLSNHDEVKQLAKDAKDFGVNILINNAAIVCPSKELSLYSDNEIKDMVEVNLTSPILLTFYLLDQLTDIININSMVGLEVKSPRTLYSATKWGLRGFAQSLKEENKNVNVLDVYPTNIKTTPDRQNAMDVSFVVDNIYNSFLNKEQTLILDGRK